MDTIKRFLKRNPLLGGGITFALLSLIGNIISILIKDMAHIRDIVHVLPTVIIYEPIIKMTTGYVPSEFVFIPLVVIIDFVIGMLVGYILNKFTKTENSYLIGLIIIFLIYWVGITYQWLPIL